MNQGDAFVPLKANDHLHVVVSDPKLNPDRVLLLFVTTYVEGDKESACLFNANEHEWIVKKSCVAYNYAKVVKADDLDKLRVAGKLKMFQPMPPHLLKRIIDGSADSEWMEESHADILIEQGLLDL